MTELRNSQADLARFQWRVVVLAVVVLLCFGVLAWRLVVLQVMRHDDLSSQAENNRTAVVPIVPSRGQILDRNGVVLATNYAAYTLEVSRERAKDLDAVIAQLKGIIEVQPRDLRRFKRLMGDSKSFESLPLRLRLTEDEVARFAAQAFRFPGVEVKARLFRTYPYGELGSHLIGYIGRINEKEKEQLEDDDEAANYRGTDYIGKLGVEQSYESQLHGTTGVEQIETSAGGRAVRQLGSKPATPGHSVVLTIDIKLQKLIEDLFGKRRGALVAIDPQTGEVLAFVSLPTFDPNLFVDGIDQDSWDELNTSIDKPLLNRALRGTYPPGSTYKPFMAMAALTTGKRGADTIIQDNGSWTYGNHTFRSHGDHGLGPVNMVRALEQSSNVYFYSLAAEMGVDAIHDFMAPLGFGQITGIDLRGEVRGVLPNMEWKRRAYKRPSQQKWIPGETISLGIGQGYNNFTMLQLASATATLGAEGLRRRPHVVQALQDAVSQRRVPMDSAPIENLGYKPQDVAVVRRGLVGVTTVGTSARVFAGAGYQSAGKTGTAQAVTIGKNDKYNASKLQEHQRDHALYMAYAPADKPRIALALVVENAGFGAAHAAPIARRVFDYWLLGRYPSVDDIAAVQRSAAANPIGAPRAVTDIPLPDAITPPTDSAAKTDLKTDAKTDAKTAVIAEVKADAKPDTKSDAAPTPAPR